MAASEPCKHWLITVRAELEQRAAALQEPGYMDAAARVRLLRHRCATRIQATVRRYLTRCDGYSQHGGVSASLTLVCYAGVGILSSWRESESTWSSKQPARRSSTGTRYTDVVLAIALACITVSLVLSVSTAEWRG